MTEQERNKLYVYNEYCWRTIEELLNKILGELDRRNYGLAEEKVLSLREEVRDYTRLSRRYFDGKPPAP